jgi:hypothetical protein
MKLFLRRNAIHISYLRVIGYYEGMRTLKDPDDGLSDLQVNSNSILLN